MIEKVLNRAGKPCGMYFCLQGPRAVRSRLSGKPNAMVPFLRPEWRTDSAKVN